MVEDIYHLLDCTTTHPDAQIKYHASDMVLHIDSGAFYLLVQKVRSRIGGHHFLSSRSADDTKLPS